MSYKKRVMDIVLATIGIVIVSPLMLAIYLALKASSHSPALFKQERIGKGGKPFNIYKFRTMSENDEDNGIPMLAQEDDDRLTRLGRLLRSHHLDELPQLWNVVRGDMSLVGYRPERKYFIDKIMELRPDYARLYAIRPGITSRATIENGYTYNMEKMIRRLDLDLEYLENHSVAKDLKIILNTFTNIALGKIF